jgi:hypothetical protein
MARRRPRRGSLRFGVVVALVPCALMSGLGGCSTIPLYTEPGAPNLRFRATSSDRLFMYTTIDLAIHRVTADCHAELVGSHLVWAPLRQATEPVHLPQERLSLLEFKFHQHGNIESWTSYTTLLRPRAGQTYEAAVTHDAGLYVVEIRETGPGGRRIEHWSLPDCHRA